MALNLRKWILNMFPRQRQGYNPPPESGVTPPKRIPPPPPPKRKLTTVAICPECGTVGIYVDRLRVLKCEECSYCAHNSMTDGKCNDCGMTDDDIWDEAEHQ